MFVLLSSLYKSKQFLWLVLKLAIVISCGYFIYDKLAYNEDIEFSNFWSYLINFDVFSLKNGLFLIFFTFFNWIMEITKWRLLTKKINPISWSMAAIQTLSSSAFAMITPVRTGEYGIKILYYPKTLRKEIALAAFAGNIYQLFISLVVGSIGIVYLYRYFDKGFISVISLTFLGGLFLTLILFLLRSRFTVVRTWFAKFLAMFRFTHNREYRSAFLLSLLRYLIFSHQFYFLITLFEIDLSYVDAMACITAMYGLTSVVPILPIFDFLLKGSVSIMVFSFFSVNPIWIICITSLMWILNFAIPSILGSYYILRLKPNFST